MSAAAKANFRVIHRKISSEMAVEKKSLAKSVAKPVAIPENTADRQSTFRESCRS